MNDANYVPLPTRLSQGDIVRAPIGVFGRRADLADPSLVDAAPAPLAYGEPHGTAVAVPWQTAAGADGPLVLRAWHFPAVVVTLDCGIDKAPPQVLVAPILPLMAAQPSERDGIRAGTYLMALYLPPEPEMIFADGSRFSFPESYVDFTRTTAVSLGLLMAERMVALSGAQVDRFQEAWVRFVAGRELSSTGTVAAAAGKRIRSVETLESSRRRHTVLFTFEDDSIVVLYQEPRRRGDHLQEIQIRGGTFDPPEVQAVAGSNLVLRFENEDRRDWRLAGEALGLSSCRIAAAATTSILVQCPQQPGELRLVNLDRRGQTLHLRIVRPAETDTA
ncbi:MAG: hypothetical protein HY332_13905 [Chloroflexi bacterium]|nr:hypothetical protein [Chloroflexota bacterium]